MESKDYDLKDLSNWSKTLGWLKSFVLIVVILSMLTVGGVYYLYIDQSKKMNAKLEKALDERFILDPSSGRYLSGSFRLLNTDDWVFQRKAVVKNFAKCFYEFDGYDVRRKLNEGVHWCTEEIASVKLNQYLRGSKGDLRLRLKDEKLSWKMDVDSIEISTQDLGMSGILYAKRSVIGPAGSNSAKFKAYYELEEMSSLTERNPIGYRVKVWRQVK